MLLTTPLTTPLQDSLSDPTPTSGTAKAIEINLLNMKEYLLENDSIAKAQHSAVSSMRIMAASDPRAFS